MVVISMLAVCLCCMQGRPALEGCIPLYLRLPVTMIKQAALLHVAKKAQFAVMQTMPGVDPP